jgi:hypothetical protein
LNGIEIEFVLHQLSKVDKKPIEFIIKQIEVANPSTKTTAMHCPKANKKALDEGLVILAERAGFEPAVGLTLRTLSRRVT